jgi:Sec-independent protein translocase protein TatA
LAVTISTAAALAGTTIAATATATAVKTIAMTTLQKTILTATVAAAVGSGIYEARQAANARNEAQTLQQQQAPLTDQNQQLQRERDETARQLASLREENERLHRDTGELVKLRAEVTRLKSLVPKRDTTSESATTSPAESWMKRVSSLKAKLAQIPGANIPELDYLTQNDWMEATKGNLETEEDYRRALALLRHLGQQTFASMLHNALHGFLGANKDELPTEVAQLTPYFQSPIREDLLQGYQILPANQLNFPTAIMDMVTAGKNWVITQKAPIDEQFDWRSAIGVGTFVGLGPGVWPSDKDKPVGPNQK